MGTLLILILLSAAVSAAIYAAFAGIWSPAALLDSFRTWYNRKANPTRPAYVDCGGGDLNCRVTLTKEKKSHTPSEGFSVDVCGSLYVPEGTQHVVARVDVTEWTEAMGPVAVQSRIERWRKKNSRDFVYSGDLGRIAPTANILDNWLRIGTISSDWIIFARRGNRKLLFNVSIESRESGDVLARGQYVLDYRNEKSGYIDLRENIQRANTLAVAIAFAVSAVDKKIYDSQVQLIKQWARRNIDISKASKWARRNFEKALNQTVDFFRSGNQINCHKVCDEIVAIMPLPERYHILELCLWVAKAKQRASEQEVTLLKNLASWLRLDAGRFRTMMQKILPVNMHDCNDVEAVLGVTSDMDTEQTRQRLNTEYRKWNSRVTSSDPGIQAQADHMLKFIAEARVEYIA